MLSPLRLAGHIPLTVRISTDSRYSPFHCRPRGWPSANHSHMSLERHQASHPKKETQGLAEQNFQPGTAAQTPARRPTRAPPFPTSRGMDALPFALLPFALFLSSHRPHCFSPLCTGGQSWSAGTAAQGDSEVPANSRCAGPLRDARPATLNGPLLLGAAYFGLRSQGGRATRQESRSAGGVFGTPPQELRNPHPTFPSAVELRCVLVFLGFLMNPRNT